MWNNALVSVLIVLSIVACENKKKKVPLDEVLPFIYTSDYTPHWINPSDSKYDEIPIISDFSFIDQNNEVVNNNTFKGKIYITDFFFTICPSICPRLTKSMYDVQFAFKDDQDILLLSHTVTPWIDSVDVLKSYAELNQAIDGKWYFVTGDEAEIYEIARKSYLADEDFGFTENASDFIHTDKFTLVDKKGRVRGIYSGLSEKDVDRLIEDIRILQKENDE